MTRKVICGILAILLLLSVAVLPLNILAAEDATEGTTASTTTDATEGTLEPATMQISDEMMALLKRMEGFAKYPYWDYKQWSVGYGCECPADKLEEYKKNGITDEEGEALLRKELDYFEKEVNDFLQKNKLTVTQNQYDALVSFSYNCGANWTSGSGNMKQAVLDGDMGAAITYGMMLWSTAGKKYVLIPRRMMELDVYVNNKYEYRWEPVHDQYRYVFLNGAGGTTDYKIQGFDITDPTHIRTLIKKAPTGPDETGTVVTYVFDGWYTARDGGTKVETLDETMESGTMLYAHWKTPNGTPVVIPEEDVGISLDLTVTASVGNVRSGPYTYHKIIGQLKAGDKITVTKVVVGGNYSWGRFEGGWISLSNTDYQSVIEEYFPVWYRVTAEEVTVHASADSTSKVVATLKKEDQVLVEKWSDDDKDNMWVKIENGWIPLSSVSLTNIDEIEDKEIASIQIHQMPTSPKVVQMSQELDLTGGLLLVTYADGSKQILDMTKATVPEFDASQIGKVSVTIKLGNAETTLEVEIVKATVIFQMEDGTIISKQEYLYGDEVQIPENPVKPEDEYGHYSFIGWDKEVTACQGNAVYTAKFELIWIPGDFDSNEEMNDLDAVHLLMHYFFPDDYKITGRPDINNDGQFDDLDAVHLLMYYFFPDDYPLYPGNN